MHNTSAEQLRNIKDLHLEALRNMMAIRSSVTSLFSIEIREIIANKTFISRYQAPANSVAPPSVYKPHTTHNSSIRSDEGLTLETSAFESLYGG